MKEATMSGSQRSVRRVWLPDVEPLPPMSVRERVARGLAARDRVPLEAHGR
jgi:hypothetical protein